jgi:hypothetical protein
MQPGIEFYFIFVLFLFTEKKTSSLVGFLTSIRLLLAVICSRALFERLLVAAQSVHVLAVSLRVLVVIDVILRAREIWAAVVLLVHENAWARRRIRLRKQREKHKEEEPMSEFSIIYLSARFNARTWSLHTRRTQTRFLFEHLQRRHGSLDGIIDVSANIVLLWRQPVARAAQKENQEMSQKKQKIKIWNKTTSNVGTANWAVIKLFFIRQKIMNFF